MECSAFLLLWSIGAIAIGIFGTYVSLLGWINPQAPLVQLIVIPSRPWHFQIQRCLGLIVGPVFFIAGCYALWGELHCTNMPVQIAGVTHLQFKLWPGVVPLGLFAAGIGVVNAIKFRMRPLMAFINVVLTALFGVCVAEAAGYHTGEMADRWGTACIIALLLNVPFAAISYFTARQRKRQRNPAFR